MRKLLLIIIVLVLFIPGRVSADASVRVYYQGPEDGGLQQALRLNPNFSLVDAPDQADVILLNGTIPDAVQLRRQVEKGTGLVLVLGPSLKAEPLETLFGEPVSITPAQNPLSLNAVPLSGDSVTNDIIWTSATQLRERYITTASGFTPLVSGYEDGSLILGSKKIGLGQVYLFTAFLNHHNSSFQEWAYYNYLIYHLTQQASGRAPLPFSDYAGSPVPHSGDRALLFTGLAGLLLVAVTAFILVRKYSLAHPEALDVVVSNVSDYQEREAATGWEEVGFHRPLGGFFVAFFLGLVVFVPLIVYQNLILPTYILPSAQAMGIWGRVTQFFNLVWLFFDMGTSVAFIKFLSQHRVHDPRKGIQYGQVFVWWQTLSGAVQVTLMVALAGTVMPKTAYAIYAWSVIIHAFIQIPGFYMVVRHALTGLQRFDYAQILDIAEAVLFPMLAQPVLVLLMVSWGRSHPIFGTSMGGLLGMGLAAYAAELFSMILGLLLFLRLGYRTRVYFLAHFNWQIIKESFRYGVFEMFGSIAWGIGQSVEILITQHYLVNYAEVWGNWVLAQNFVFAFQVLQSLYSNLMPSISEAISHGRRILSQYYSALGYQWGGIISAFLASVLLAVADRFIIGASGPEFVRAATYSTPLIIWGAIQYASWVGDNVQRGTNRTWLVFMMVTLEQTIRIGLAFLLVGKLQINALILAYFAGLLIKNVLMFFINHRVCYPQRLFIWQSLAAPILAGLVNYTLLRWLGTLLWRGDQLTSLLILFIAILPAYPLFPFFYALFGGWETGTLAEVRKAADLSSFLRPLAWLFWASSDLGARLSPLHNRFKISIRDEALEEAASLTRERVSLVGAEPGAVGQMIPEPVPQG